MVGLMDCNNFFVSCERLFRPDLAKKPVAVLSSNDGCIVSRSQEVKDLGIPMGVPHFEIKDLCKKHKITVFSSNFTLYRDISARVMAALREEFDSIEVYSVDEAFFDVSDSIDHNELVSVRERIIKKTGIPVSFGIAPTKTIAKVANAYAKKSSGVCVLPEDTWRNLTSEVLCGSVWGIGRQTAQKLTKMGILTVNDLLACDRAVLGQSLGVIGERLWFELSGVAMSQAESTDGRIERSITSTRSFSKKTHNKLVLQSALGYHATNVAKKLRDKRVVASRITIFLAPSRFSDFATRPTTIGEDLTPPTNSTVALIQVAERLLERMYDKEIPYAKAGVVVSNIVPAEAVSSSLFGNVQRLNDLSETIDELNERFGNEALRYGIVTQSDGWRERAELKSPEYTTRWSEIVSVKATI